MKKKKEKKSPQKVLLRRYRRIKALIKEINKCLDAKLWYAALVLILILPDICAALESLKGKSEQRPESFQVVACSIVLRCPTGPEFPKCFKIELIYVS